ncbi:hypothetical protein [Eisenibacter elegans]|jgi:hypothetical protein|uniref:hypothetical protein n=1 Tax=Eisenibacter elegans TaxID=997 RepID=UPI00040D7A62|nr:hypothetical protein [Eisenibacter elegans]
MAKEVSSADTNPDKNPPKEALAAEASIIPNKGNSNLQEALLRAEMLLAHASEQGVEIHDDLTRKVVRAKYLEKTQNWSEEEESEFWIAYRKIAKSIHPVTINSLLAAIEKRELPRLGLWGMMGFTTKITLAQRAVQRYTYWALFFLFLMLVVQIFFLIGSTILSNIKERDKQIQQLEEMASRLKDNVSEVERINTDIDKISTEREKNIIMLARWQSVINRLILDSKPYDLSIFEERQRVRAASFRRINNLSTEVEQAAIHPLMIIGSYILPLLYGLLGAYAYVLRVLSEEIKHQTYSRESDIKYQLRVRLGALAGLVVGILTVTGEESFMVSISSLSPVALAFIAGYSIEFVFTLVDRLISNVTTSAPGGKK